MSPHLIRLSMIFSLFSYSSFLLSSEPVADASSPYSTRIGTRHIENKGVGYNTGYTTLELFSSPFVGKWNWTPFIDLRGHLLDNGKFASNLGAGVRTIKSGRIYGGNAYYDYRQTSRSHYNQFSLGLETLGVRWDYRLNGYLPVGKKTSKVYDYTSSTKYTFNSFKGNELFLTEAVNTKGKIQYSMRGVDAEAAFHFLKSKNFDLSAAAGPYYYNYKNKQAIGGKARISCHIYNYLSLEMINSYDSRFHENIQGSIGFHVPLGKNPKKQKTILNHYTDSSLLLERLVQDIKRQEIIVLDHFQFGSTKKKSLIAIDPLTRNPFHFLFVDNLSHSQGTFESPYNTLAAASNASSPYDIIYIFAGDGTTTGLDTGITLLDHQKLWGAGITQHLNTSVGKIQIPLLSPNSSFQSAKTSLTLPLAPIITSFTGDVVALANDNEISGLYIINMMGHGITAPEFSITSLIAQKNIIQGPSESNYDPHYGVNLENVSGAVLIKENNFLQDFAGIYISTLGIQDTSYIISHNEVTSSQNFLLSSYIDSSHISTIVHGNAGTTPSFCNMTFDNASLETASLVSLKDNIIHSAISLRYTLNNAANLDLLIENNHIECLLGTGLEFYQSGTSQLNLQALKNTFYSIHGIFGTMQNNSQLKGFMSENDLFVSTSAPSISVEDQSTVSHFSIINNRISYSPAIATLDGIISLNTSGTASLEAFVLHNKINSSYTGIHLTANDNSSLIGAIENNIFSDIIQYGIHLETRNSSTGLWNVAQNTIGIISGSQFLGTPFTGAALIASYDTSNTILNFVKNTTSPLELTFIPPHETIGMYQFAQNDSSTFELESTRGNRGMITETGIISSKSTFPN